MRSGVPGGSTVSRCHLILQRFLRQQAVFHGVKPINQTRFAEGTSVGCSRRPQSKLDGRVFQSGQRSELQLRGVVRLDFRALLS
jgi:hypothetical protein